MFTECGRVAQSNRHFVCRYRDSAQFQDVEVPLWANEIADRIAPGSSVRIGFIGTAPVVESVLVPVGRAADADEAASIAERIVETIES